MNADLVNWTWERSKVINSPRLVLLALAHKANIVGEATVTVAELSRICKLTDEEIRNGLRAIIAAKEIVIFQNYGEDGTRQTNTYRFTCLGPRVKPNGEEDDLEFGDELPGVDVPKAKDLPKEPQPKIMMDGAQLEAIAADPIYRGLDVRAQAWKFKRWCHAQVPPAEETVRRFKVWLSKV